MTFFISTVAAADNAPFTVHICTSALRFLFSFDGGYVSSNFKFINVMIRFDVIKTFAAIE